MSSNKLEMPNEVCQIQFGKSNKYNLKIPLPIPSTQCPRELAYRIVKLHNIPVCHHEELSQKLDEVISANNIDFHSKQGSECIKNLRSGKLNLRSIASQWGSRYSRKSSPVSEVHNSDLASMYHSLVHSSTAQTLLSLEHSYADAVSSLVMQKECAIEELRNGQSQKMQETVSHVGANKTDDDVNQLAARQLEDLQMLEVQWDSTILALKEQQKREFRNFIQESFEGKEVTTPITPKEFLDSSSAENSMVVIDAPEVSHEESFTIHLGTQMKQMHNLRLLSADVLDLFKYQQLDDSSGLPPQRIQTSMSLYSYNLNGLVLLVDDRISTYSGIKKEFGRVSSRSTEFHFAELEDQLEAIRDMVPSAVQWRRDHPPVQYDGDREQQSPVSVRQNLKVGDMYLTKHSNLADVHVVYHLVTDDSIRSPDINSRHSVILGLRNVLKAACLGDVTTLTVPLLLTHTLSEEMTISWCQKRAELVYKCIKGFMMEMTSWGGADMKNLQFLVPRGISEDLFQTLASMLQSIFRVSNPLIVKGS